MAQERKCKKPGVLGAIIATGNLLDLTLGDNRDMLEWSYAALVEKCAEAGLQLPKNNKKGYNRLDCKVIQTLHEGLILLKKQPFDTVRGLFEEGEPIYQGSRFHKKSHVQLAVRNPSHIIGYFLPRNMDGDAAIQSVGSILTSE